VNDRNELERRSFVSPKLILGLIVILLLVVFWARNRRETTITFWVADATVKVWVALLVASVAGFIAGYLLRGSGRD
jgi:uncharacterized integral membrane protein